MAFSSVRDFVSSGEDDGKRLITSWRKAPVQTTVAGQWFDLSMSPGNPPPQYYAASPLAARPMSQSVDGGIFHGQPVTPEQLHLHRLTVMNTVLAPTRLLLCDYLLYYPFADMGVVGAPQTCTNAATVPRYPTGEGVQMMAVIVAAQIGGQSFNVTYTNSLGVPGRTTPNVTLNGVTATGTIATTTQVLNGGAGPFIPLQTGDTGVRSVEAVTMNGEDTGLFTIVLVKPLADIRTVEVTAPVEVDYLLDRPSLPVIRDDAFLMFIAYVNGTLASAPFNGTAEYVWS